MTCDLFEIVSFYVICLDGQDLTACIRKPKLIRFRVYATGLIVVYKVNDVCYCKLLAKVVCVSK